MNTRIESVIGLRNGKLSRESPSGFDKIKSNKLTNEKSLGKKYNLTGLKNGREGKVRVRKITCDPSNPN